MLAKFETYFDGENWCARGIGADVFTQGASLDELMNNIREAAVLHFEDAWQRGEPGVHVGEEENGGLHN